jgi:hypothetical protein
MTLSFESDGQILKSTYNYTLIRSGRDYESKHEPQDRVKATFSVDMKLCVPSPLRYETWRRYQFTSDDVRHNISCMDEIYTLQLAMMLLNPTDYPPCTFLPSIRNTFQSMFSLLFVPRKIMQQALWNVLPNYYPLINGESVLCADKQEHHPILPKVGMHAYIIKKLLLCLPPRPPSFCWCAKLSFVFSFRGILMIPMKYDSKLDLLLMVRVIKRDVYENMTVRSKACVLNAPVFIISDHVEYVLTEESCFFFENK